MKKLLVSTLLVALVLAGCGSNKSDSSSASASSEESSSKAEVSASVEASSSDVAASPEESVQDVAEGTEGTDENVSTSITKIETSDGIVVSFTSDTFSREEIEDSDSITLVCEVDPEHRNENYIDLLYTDEYSAEDLYEGIKLQGTDSVIVDEDITVDGVNGKVYQYKVSEEFILTFYVFPHNEGAYKIEIGNHFYPDGEEEMAYAVSDTMDEVVQSIELNK